MEDLEDLTLGHLLHTLKRLKISALVSIITLTLTVLSSAFVAGRLSQSKQTAVSLQTPFALRLVKDGTKLDYERLLLLKDPTQVPPTTDTEVLVLREVLDEFDVVPIGVVIAQTPHTETTWPLSWFAGIEERSLIDSAWADAGFDLGPHKGDFKYVEVFVDPETINRAYSDGCVLEYRLNKSRRSDQTSFKWIKNIHG